MSYLPNSGRQGSLSRPNSRLSGLGEFFSASKAWWLGLVCLTIFRLMLCAKDEISSLPDDSINYAYLAVAYLSGLPSDRLPAQRPGIGLLAQAATGVGIPYKLLLDGLLCLLAFQLASLIRRWTGSTTLGLVTYCSLVLNQWFVLFSQLFLSEPATALAWALVWLATCPFFVTPPSLWKLGAMLPATLASCAVVLLRPEEAVLYGYWLSVAVLAIAVWRSRWWELTRLRRLSCLGLVILPMVASWGTLVVWKQIHRVQYGIPGLTRSETPGIRALLNALYSIRPKEEIRFAPVTRQTLQEACDQSPTLNQYREQLLDTGGVYYQVAKQNLGLNGEVGTWLNWHLDYSFAKAGSRAESEKKLAATELNEAFRRGQLKRRWGMYPIDPLWRLWSQDIPDAFRKGLVQSFWPLLPLNIEEAGAGMGRVSLLEGGVFDDGLLRRKGTRNDLNFRIKGRTPSISSSFRQVRLTNDGNQIVGTARIVRAHGAGYEFDFVLNLEGLSPNQTISIEFLPAKPDGQSHPRFSLPLSDSGTWVNLSRPAGPAAEQNTADEFWNLESSMSIAANDWRIRLKSSLARRRGAIALGLSVLCFGLGLCTRLGSLRCNRLLVWLLAGWILFFGRMAYYVLCETWLRWGIERYLGPNYFLATGLVGPTLFVFGQSLRRTFRWFTRRIFFRNEKRSVTGTTVATD